MANNLPPKPDIRVNAQKKANEVAQGARNMRNLRRTEKRKRVAQSKNQRRTAKRNRNQVRKNVREQKTRVLETGRRSLSRSETDTMNQLDEYIRYCNDLRASYEVKHGEVQGATDMIRNIRADLDQISDDVLKHLGKIESLNNGVSENNNKSDLNNYMGNDIGYSTDEILSILERIRNKVPSELREHVERLKDLQVSQAEMTRVRQENHSAINDRVQAIKDRMRELKSIKGMGPKKPERGRNENARPFTRVEGRKAARARTPTRQEVRNQGGNASGPRTERAKQVQTELNSQKLSKGMRKMFSGPVSGRNTSPLRSGDFN